MTPKAAVDDRGVLPRHVQHAHRLSIGLVGEVLSEEGPRVKRTKGMIALSVAGGVLQCVIEALPRLRRRLPGLRAVIAGRGGHTDALEQQVRARRLGRAVDFVGWLPDAELHGLIAAADVLVVPSLYEPFGLVALEGAALGAPLAVARTGGLAEFVQDGVTGRVFEPGDAPGLADAVTGAIRDPESSRRMAEAARSSLRDAYGWALVAAKTADAYEQALAESRPRVPAPPARLAGRSVNLLRS